jgi:hypothetical protein
MLLGCGLRHAHGLAFGSSCVRRSHEVHVQLFLYCAGAVINNMLN